MCIRDSRDGWFITGDVGSYDHEGRVTLEGRAGDMIISGGLNVYPKEVETVIDAIDGIIESAVIGVPDPDFGEAVLAVVVTESSLASGEPVEPTLIDDIVLLSKMERELDSSLARFKHPRRFHAVSALPRNAMGKVQKVQLRTLLG